MTRLVTFLPVAVVVCVAGLFITPVFAQVSTNLPEPVSVIAASQGELQGVVTDDRGAPLQGVVVSALGSSSAFSITDRAGRFAFRPLAPGPYLVRAHLDGYVPARGRIVQVNSAARAVSTLTLAKRGGPNEPAQILAAGAAPADVPDAPATSVADDDHDHGETAWRLRHLKRSVLKDAGTGVVLAGDDDSFIEDSFETLGRAMGQSARVATSLFADLTLSGQVNLLTTTTFNQPQELFSAGGGPPRGIAFVSLKAPSGAGEWNVRGAMTEGDLASWVLAGSYERRSRGPHQYQAGLSYSMQRYEGGNPAALVAVTRDSRQAAEVYAYDSWTVVPRITLDYGARHSRYGYLEDVALWSPRLSVTFAPIDGVDDLRFRIAAAHREVAPGAEEFAPTASLGVLLPPQRTFSPISRRRGFVAERMDHYEIAGEYDIPHGFLVGVRAFHQRIDDQMITLFGVSVPDTAVADLGHYYVASAGDLQARGWGVSVSRSLTGRVRGSIDYTRTEADWLRRSPDARLLSRVAPSTTRDEGETVHDLTTSVVAQVPVTETRVYVLYKLNTGFAASQAAVDGPHVGSRFDLQVNQALPFLDFTSAQWEALFTVRSLFREDVAEASIYDELLVVKPPKRVVGGLTVRF
jgi:TonB dependent receptor/Carboxypeptidase regulatory-like domain